MTRYIQKLSFGIGEREWWVGWELDGPPRRIAGLIPADTLSSEELLHRGVTSFQPVNSDLLARLERRTVQRVRLTHPFRGKAGAVDVLVVDISAGGIGICHEFPLRPGKVLSVDFMGDDQFYSMSYDLLRCQLSRASGRGEARYYSALRLRNTSAADRKALARLVAQALTANEAAIREDPGRALALD